MPIVMTHWAPCHDPLYNMSWLTMPHVMTHFSPYHNPLCPVSWPILPMTRPTMPHVVTCLTIPFDPCHDPVFPVSWPTMPTADPGHRQCVPQLYGGAPADVRSWGTLLQGASVTCGLRIVTLSLYVTRCVTCLLGRVTLTLYATRCVTCVLGRVTLTLYDSLLL